MLYFIDVVWYTVLYAEQNIKEIVDEIKANDNIKWKNTIIVITSDNGAIPGTGRLGPLFGSPLPFRGRKSYFCIYFCLCISIINECKTN